jgi:hypothetical protein
MELDAFGFGCGVVDVDGVCSAVVLRMATEMGPVTVISRVTLTPEVTRALAKQMQDMAAKVDAKEQILHVE